ncbi:MAG: T9SS type A sorting domain-containing protein [Bacteroidales bacterium]|nr:T9SS type A sorting domain-containing protein [Bacteroidales bacterium]
MIKKGTLLFSILILLIAHVQGQVSFGSKQVIDNALSQTGMHVADVNNDGLNDVLFYSGAYGFYWYENKGGGNFSTKNKIYHWPNQSVGLPVQSVFPVDIDGDEDKDLLIGATNNNHVAVFINDGSGNFGAPNLITDSAKHAQCVHAGDLNGDNNPDVVSASGFNNEITWYENNGNGNFGYQNLISDSIDAYSIDIEDIDGDGDNDVLAADYNKVVWYKNDGNGKFSYQKIFSATPADSIGAIVENSAYAKDLNGNGRLDVLYEFRLDYSDGSNADNYKYMIAWHENNGSGSFGSQQVITDTIWNGSSVDGRKLYPSDIDGDGDIDILTTYYYYDVGNNQSINKIMWFENDGNGNFFNTQIISDSHTANFLYAADLDGDMDKDVISNSPGNYGLSILWFENKGGVGVSNQTQQNFSLYPNPTTGLVKISAERQIKSLYVTDITGKILNKFDGLNTRKKTVDLSGLETGVYILQIHTEKGVSSAKVIKE